MRIFKDGLPPKHDAEFRDDMVLGKIASVLTTPRSMDFAQRVVGISSRSVPQDPDSKLI